MSRISRHPSPLPASRCMILAVSAVWTALPSFADSLIWTGGNSGTWNASSANLVWKDGSGAATAWIDGSDAVFDGSAQANITVSGPMSAHDIAVKPGTEPIYFLGDGPLSWTGGLTSAGGHGYIRCPLVDDGNGLHFNFGGHLYLQCPNRHTGGTYIKNTVNNALRAFIIDGANGKNANGDDLALGPVPETVQTNIFIEGGTVALHVGSSQDISVHRNRTILIRDGKTFYVAPNGMLRIKGDIASENAGTSAFPTGTRLYVHNNNNSWLGRTVLYGNNYFGKLTVTGNLEIHDGTTRVVTSGQGTGDAAALYVQGNGSSYTTTRGYLLVSGGTLVNSQSGYRFHVNNYGHIDIAGGKVSMQYDAKKGEYGEYLNGLSSPGKTTIRDGGLLSCSKFRLSQTTAGNGGELFLEEGGTLRARYIGLDFNAARKGVVHFNGGALQSLEGNSNTSSTESPSNANWAGSVFSVEAGGAVFDTANGQHIWFGRPLLSGVAAGETDGGLTCRLYSGRAVVLHEAFSGSTYTGPTRLEAAGSGTGDRTLQCRVANALPAAGTLQVGPGCKAGFNSWAGASGSAERENADLPLTIARLEGAGYLFYDSLLNVTEAIAPVFDGAYGTLSFEKPFASNCDLEITGDANGCGRVEFKRAGQSIAGLSLKADTTGLSNEKGAKFYKIVDAPNGYTGQFASTDLPSNWQVVYENNAVYLAPVNPFMLVVR